MDTGLEVSGEVQYRGDPVLVPPRRPTPRHELYLSNLDDQRFLRFSIKYLYVFSAGAAVPADALRAPLTDKHMNGRHGIAGDPPRLRRHGAVHGHQPLPLRRHRHGAVPACMGACRQGYYGNGFVLGCAESTAGQVAAVAAPATVIRLVQKAKERVDDDYVRSMVDLLEERRVGTGGGAKPDLSASLVISAWTRLGLEDLDFGAGTPAHMGPLTSEIYCVFVPVAGDPGGVTVLVSVPQAAADKFEHYCCNPVEPSGVEDTDDGAIAAGMLERDEQHQPCHGHEIKIDY
ncbi:unnamed protein product [Triticum turgidum subsp. durum]|uniref:Omega-hydroxypalmitate O-feruloyl transferase n=1 Tax=Triticum turgidum subsp. durum TaxID=4567 RepID=A0A9R0REH6_TRITD|nr:unnamed protein product [Triticum turgidum subsp. durum]